MNGPLLQREQYAKGGIGEWYLDFRDRRTLSYSGDEKEITDSGGSICIASWWPEKIEGRR
jgi:hypothetical protein